jgi:hypothetical protein
MRLTGILSHRVFAVFSFFVLGFSPRPFWASLTRAFHKEIRGQSVQPVSPSVRRHRFFTATGIVHNEGGAAGKIHLSPLYKYLQVSLDIIFLGVSLRRQWIVIGSYQL